MPEDRLLMRPGNGGYLAFLGRVSPEKGVDQAINIALRTGWPLKIAAKIDRADQEYFSSVIKPQLDHPLVEFVGEIGYPCKNDFLGDALALLFPIDWPEPFGLVMMESLACGTPVIAYPRGSVPEIVEDGVSGFLVRNVEQAAEAVRRIDRIDRKRCRQRFEERFTAKRMCDDYLALYERLVYGESELASVSDGVPVG
jgi:glycosyltransferase involved in cell wall biosynthesis